MQIQLTIQQKIEAVEIGIRHLTYEKAFYICQVLFWSIRDSNLIDRNKFTKYDSAYGYAYGEFVELHKYKPIGAIGNVWFNCDDQGRQSRIEILSQLLTEYKSML